MGDKPVKVGGQALADGVFMRTERAWAIARDDGSIEVGEVPPNRFAPVPVLRVLSSLLTAMKLGIGKGLLGDKSNQERGQRRGERVKARLNQRFLVSLVAIEAVVAGLGWGIDRLPIAGLARTGAHLVPWIAVLAALRVAAPAAVWRYHGAEHKAVSAHEQGVDLADVDAVLACSRVHDRCGTNLVFLMTFGGALLQSQPTIVQIPGFLIGLAAAAEVMALAARWPRSLPSRALLWGGKLLQRWVTTVEPTPAEQVVGCRALVAALAEHDRLTNPAELEPLAA